MSGFQEAYIKHTFTTKVTELKVNDEQQTVPNCKNKFSPKVKQDLLNAKEQSIHEIKLLIKSEPADVQPEVELEGTEHDLINQVQRDRKELYFGHEIKQEMVIGPEVVQQNGAETGSLTSDIGIGSDCSQTTCAGSSLLRAMLDAGRGGDTRQPRCALCSRECSNESDLALHMRVHTKERTCNSDPKSNKEIETITSRTWTHIPDKFYFCDICSKPFSTRCSLINHMQTHTGDNPYSSDICNKKFTKSYTLTKHMQIHTSEKPNSCNVCEMTFTQKSSLTYHMRTHTSIHMQIHSGDKPYGCDICSKNFSHSTALRNHMRIHASDKPFSCNICNKRFSANSNLTSHMRTHTDKKPYGCGICSKQFTHSRNVKSHLRIHASDENYDCDMCNKKFTQRSNFIYHIMLTHSADRPYICDYCNKKFNQKSILSHHMRIHMC